MFLAYYDKVINQIHGMGSSQFGESLLCAGAYLVGLFEDTTNLCVCHHHAQGDIPIGPARIRGEGSLIIL